MNASVRLSVSSLRAHKRRFAGTFLAVFLGVAFLAGTLVMGDTLRASFDTMFGNATSGTDAVVRSADAITTPGESQGVRQPVSTALVKEVEKVPGVAAAHADEVVFLADGCLVDRMESPTADKVLDRMKAFEVPS